MVDISLDVDPFATPEQRKLDAGTPETQASEVVEVKKTEVDVDLTDLQPAMSTTQAQKDSASKIKAPQAKGLTPAQKAIGVAQGGAQVLNSIIEFEQLESKAMMNTALANIQFNEALQIGRQQALKAETAGFARGEQALLEAAAQGQEVTGGIAQSAQRAQETLGILSAITIESNAIAEAYGFKAEADLIEHELNLAEIQRNANIITGVGTSALALI